MKRYLILLSCYLFVGWIIWSAIQPVIETLNKRGLVIDSAIEQSTTAKLTGKINREKN